MESSQSQVTVTLHAHYSDSSTRWLCLHKKQGTQVHRRAFIFKRVFRSWDNSCNPCRELALQAAPARPLWLAHSTESLQTSNSCLFFTCYWLLLGYLSAIWSMTDFVYCFLTEKVTAILFCKPFRRKFIRLKSSVQINTRLKTNHELHSWLFFSALHFCDLGIPTGDCRATALPWKLKRRRTKLERFFFFLSSGHFKNKIAFPV